MRRVDPVEALGRQVAVWQDETRPELDEDRGLGRLHATRVPSPRLHQQFLGRRGLAVAFAAVLATLALLVFRLRQPLELIIDGAEQASDSSWLEGAQAVTVRFSDGSRVEAMSGSRWRVHEVRPDGATVQLERGELVASVRSGRAADWDFEAGPFAIRVTGTAFRTTWDPVREVFRLSMTEGTVILSGPVVGERRAVAAPEGLEVDLRRRSMAIATAPLVAPFPAPAVDSPLGESEAVPGQQPANVLPSAEPPPASASSSSSSPSPSTQSSSTEPAWRRLAQQGRHAEALDALRHDALPRQIEAAGPGLLLEMAQVARLGGDAPLATELLERLQQRHPDSAEAGAAQFLAGKHHYDRRRDSEAIAALSSYLARAGDASFESEASVLLILALERSGRREEARARARALVARNPTSPHAERVRRITE